MPCLHLGKEEIFQIDSGKNWKEGMEMVVSVLKVIANSLIGEENKLQGSR